MASIIEQEQDLEDRRVYLELKKITDRKEVIRKEK